MSKVEFIVPGIPTAWARARTHGKVHFTPGKQRMAMSVVQAVAYDAMEGAAAIVEPVSMKIIAIWPWPKSWSEKKKSTTLGRFKTSRPDADNVGKLISDSLNGIVFVDDAQVVDLTVCKMYGPSAETRVSVEPIKEA
jgi:Holliday junction resolvase RusA-like endonuclease